MVRVKTNILEANVGFTLTLNIRIMYTGLA